MAKSILRQLAIFSLPSAAVRRLYRTQSAASKYIASLAQRIDMRVFERSSSSELPLTTAENALLATARDAVESIDRIAAKIERVRSSQKAVVATALDVLFPSAPVLAKSAQFSKDSPATPLLLRTESLTGPAHLVATRACAATAASDHHGSESAMRIRRYIDNISMIVVCGATDPLAQHACRGTIIDHKLLGHIHIFLTDRFTDMPYDKCGERGH